MKNILLRLLVLPLHVAAGLVLCGIGGWAMFAAMFNIFPVAGGIRDDTGLLRPPTAQFLMVLLGWAALVWLTIAVHEYGHFLAARLTSLPVTLVAIWPLQWVWDDGAYRLRFFNVGRLLGLVLAQPQETDRLRQRMAIFVLGGPAASLFVGVTCLEVALVRDVSFPALWPRHAGTYWLELASLMNLYCCFVSLIPGSTGGFSTDGRRLLGYLGLSSKGESEFLLLNLGVSMIFGGTRPSAWQPSVVQRMLGLRDGSAEDVSANLYGYYYAADCKNWDQAGILLDLAVLQCKRLAPVSRDGIHLEKAYFEAVHRRNPEARTWLTRVKGEGIEAHTRLRAEAAVLFVEGRYAEAAARAQDGLAAAPQSVDRGGSVAEVDQLRELLAECQKRVIPNSDQRILPAIVSEIRQDVP